MFQIIVLIIILKGKILFLIDKEKVYSSRYCWFQIRVIFHKYWSVL